jgi:arginyl-tRNA synthetase
MSIKEMRRELEEMEKDKQEEKGKSAGIYGVESKKENYSQDSGKKQNEWNEILKMTGDKDTNVRKHAVDLLFPTFQNIGDKSGVFFDLVKLTESKDAYLRERAAELLPVAFKYSDNKQKAWNELARLPRPNLKSKAPLLKLAADTESITISSI